MYNERGTKRAEQSTNRQWQGEKVPSEKEPQQNQIKGGVEFAHEKKPRVRSVGRGLTEQLVRQNDELKVETRQQLFGNFGNAQRVGKRSKVCGTAAVVEEEQNNAVGEMRQHFGKKEGE